MAMTNSSLRDTDKTETAPETMAEPAKQERASIVALRDRLAMCNRSIERCRNNIADAQKDLAEGKLWLEKNLEAAAEIEAAIARLSGES